MQWVEEKLQKQKKEFNNLKKENASLKVSNENHIFITEKLNKALKKQETRIETLTAKVKQITDESVVFPKKQIAERNQMPNFREQ